MISSYHHNLNKLTKPQLFCVIGWAKWEFHLGFDIQAGPIISIYADDCVIHGPNRGIVL